LGEHPDIRKPDMYRQANDGEEKEPARWEFLWAHCLTAKDFVLIGGAVIYCAFSTS